MKEIDIYPTFEFSWILRQFGIAFGLVDYMDPRDKWKIDMRTIWVSKELVSKLNGNFSLFINPKKFFPKDYACEGSLLKITKKKTFDNLAKERFKPLPKLKPQVHMLSDEKGET